MRLLGSDAWQDAPLHEVATYHAVTSMQPEATFQCCVVDGTGILIGDAVSARDSS
jgi:hypothetical protein